jgi:hypothetical protein
LLFPHSSAHSPFGVPCGFLPAIGRTMGLPCSVQVTQWVRFTLFADDVWCPRGRRSETPFPSQCLLAQATQHLRLVSLNGVYQVFAYANLTTDPSPVSALMLADPSLASRFHWQPCGCGSLSAGFSRIVTFPLCCSRILLVEQQVLCMAMCHTEQLLARLSRRTTS